MAIAYDTGATSDRLNTAGTTKNSNSLTVANTADRVLFAHISFYNASNIISSVYWNTTEAMTLGAYFDDSTNASSSLYYIVNPTATTSTVTVNFSTAPADGIILVTVYNGAGTPTQFTSASYTGTSQTQTLTISSGSWIIGGAGWQRQVSAGSGTTLRQQNASLNNLGLGDSGGAPGAGSQSIIWTNATITQHGIWCELPEAGGAPTNTTNFFLMM